MMRIVGRPRSPGRQASHERHHQVAAGNERFLVRRGHDLARLECRENRAQGNEPTRCHHHEVNVGARGQRLESVRAADELSSSWEIQPRTRPIVRQGDRRRFQQPGLVLEYLALRSRCQGDHSKPTRVPDEHVDGLAPNRPGRAEQGYAGRSLASTPLPRSNCHFTEPGRSRRTRQRAPRR